MKCVHFCEAQQRGKKVKPTQWYFAEGHIAMIVVSYDTASDKLFVRKFNLQPNHCIEKEVLKHYQFHHPLSEWEQEEVNSLLKLQPSKDNLEN